MTVVLPISLPAPPVIQAQSELPVALEPGVCPAQLEIALDRIKNRLPSVRWGILVQQQPQFNAPANPPLKLGQAVLYAQNAQTALIPASNNKLLTTAAVLQQLGASYQIRTSLMGDRNSPNLSTLRVIGRGDPSLQTRHLHLLATQLRQRGIQMVGLLVGDDTFFQGAVVNPSWDAEDTLYGYAAPVNSLMVNQNAIGLTLFPQQIGQPLRVQWDDPTDAADWRLSNRSRTVATTQSEFIDVYRDRSQRLIVVAGQLRVGGESEPTATSINNPGNYLIQKFRAALTANQIQVRQATVVKTMPAPMGEVELAFVESPPLGQLIQHTNQESDNVYAEALLKTLGRSQNPTTLDATKSGILSVKQVLAPLGVNPNRYTMVDGSGLSDRNRASAETLVQTLQAMTLSPNAAVFRASLPTAGVSGTLKNRFQNTVAQGRVVAKTGTISGVVALSGYISPISYEPLSFSILANDAHTSAATIRSAIDEMVVTLARLTRC